MEVLSAHAGVTLDTEPGPRQLHVLAKAARPLAPRLVVQLEKGGLSG